MGATPARLDVSGNRRQSGPLLETASRAGRKAARGGVPNLLCIAEPLHVLSAELAGIADHITVILPWGSLLRGLVLCETASLAHVRRLCASNANLELVFSYDRERDAGNQGAFAGTEIDETYVRGTLSEIWERAGFRVISAEALSLTELCLYETTWAKRLGFGRSRKVWRIRLAADYTDYAD